MRFNKGDKWYNPGGYEVVLSEKEHEMQKNKKLGFAAHIESSLHPSRWVAIIFYTKNNTRKRIKLLSNDIEIAKKAIKEKFKKLTN